MAESAKTEDGSKNSNISLFAKKFQQGCFVENFHLLFPVSLTFIYLESYSRSIALLLIHE